MKKDNLSLAVLLACAVAVVSGQSARASADSVAGVSKARLSLDGTWQFLLQPPTNFWSATETISGWQPILVPGEPQMQGFDVRHDQEFAYQRKLELPADYAGKRVFVRFEGVYGEARVWVKGHFLRNHLGSFTPWECEVTEWVKPGEPAVLTVGVTDRTDDISAGTAYAKHWIGGILRSVTLLARSPTYVRNLRVETRLTNHFQTATLRLTADVAFAGSSEATLQFALRDPAGRQVALKNPTRVVRADKPVEAFEFSLAKPQLWDAEHPRLYALTTRCLVGGKEVSVETQAVGIREVTWGEGKLRVNGAITKLRGVCRHDMHPMLGRVSTPEYEAQDVDLLQEANVNFVRTSHYPPTENFLRLCDERGIYVECETAVCFNGSWVAELYKPKLTSIGNDAAYTPWYLGQMREMLEEFRNHPSIVIWSAGNESMFGMNFDKSLDLARELDGGRPVIFSYSKTAKARGVPDRFDLTSIHYPSPDGMKRRGWLLNENMKDWRTDSRRPSIGDEWAHVPCYARETLKIDPGIQDFWGESLNRMWASAYNSEDGIGGAIWGYMDETFQLPTRVVGYGPWGIVDTWRRKKPEFWNTQKAYSPVRVMEKELSGLTAGSRPALTIQNRYNHTDLAELTVRWNYAGKHGTFTPTALPPRATEMLLLPALPWENGTTLQLEFVEPGGRVADSYAIAIGLPVEKDLVQAAKTPARLQQTTNEVVVTGDGFSVTFDKTTGQISEVKQRGATVLVGGPRLNLSAAEDAREMKRAFLAETLNEPFTLASFSATMQGGSVVVNSNGRIGDRDVGFTTTISGNGRMAVEFKVTQPKILFGQEFGVAFVLAPGFTDITWRSDAGLWTTYPADHIGRTEGKTPLFAPELATGYREKPRTPVWALDSQDYILFGTNRVDGALTRDAKSVRQFIRSYTVSGPQRQLTVRGTGIEGARLRQLAAGEIALVVNTDWDYPNLDWGNYERGLMLPKEIRSQVTIDLGR